MISIPRRELIKHCGFVDPQLASMTANGPKSRGQGEIKECMLVFGIIPSQSESAVVDRSNEEVHYNFAVYKDFMVLQ